MANQGNEAQSGRLPALDSVSISHLSGGDLGAVFDAMLAMEQAAMGVLNRPKCWSEADRKFNAAGVTIERLLDWVSEARQSVVDAAKVGAVNPRDAEARRWIVVQHLALCQDDLQEVAIEALRRPGGAGSTQ